MTAGSYIRIFIATAALIIGAAAAINLVIDPYDISRIVRIPGLNDNKAREQEFARLRKPFDLWRRHYDGVALGASQVEQGIDPDNAALAAQGLTLYNAGLSEERPFEQALLLRHAVDVSGVKFALISLDFLRYVGGGGRPDFLLRTWTRWHGLGEYLKSLASFSTLRRSVETAIASRSHQAAAQHRTDGLLNMEGLQPLNIHQQFDFIDGVYLNSAYAPALAARAAIGRDGFDHTALRDMLATARRSGVRLYFFITPSHARQFEIIHMLGLAPLYRQWLRELACELANDAGREGAAQPFPLWDFSGYNAVTTEPVPPLNTMARMRWYFDPVHYTPAAGRVMEDRMLDLPSPDLQGLEDFGAKLTPATLDAHFAAAAQRRQDYLTAHADFSAALAALFHGADETRGSSAEPIAPRKCKSERS